LPPSAEGGGPPRPLFSERARRERRSLARRTGAPYLVPLALAAAAAFLLWRYRAELAAVNLPIAAAGPEAQVKEALRHQERASLADVYGFHAGGTVELRPVRFADVTVSAADGKAQVVAVVEAQGQAVWRKERADLSYVGHEAFRMAPCSIALWCADGQQFERLRGVLTVLFRRADAAATNDPEAAARLASDAYAGPGGKAALVSRLAGLARAPPQEVHVRAWQIRVERDRAVVGEDQEVAGPEGGTARRREVYTLAREGERWRFVDGL
jgi:hypothetical protein